MAMQRQLSVEDLFAPLKRLDVSAPLASATACPPPTSHDNPQASWDLAQNPHSRNHLRSANPNPLSEMALSELAGGQHEDEKVAASTSRSWSLKGSGGSKSPASGSDTGLQTQGNSTSDEDQQQVVDDRKQRRMLSNRESARRSRLRKQQHLDELRAHVTQLRSENSQMLNSFNLASQQYAQLTEENRILRSEALELSHQLQLLHDTVASQCTNGFRYASKSQQGGQGLESKCLPPLS